MDLIEKFLNYETSANKLVEQTEYAKNARKVICPNMPIPLFVKEFEPRRPY